MLKVITAKQDILYVRSGDFGSGDPISKTSYTLLHFSTECGENDRIVKALRHLAALNIQNLPNEPFDSLINFLCPKDFITWLFERRRATSVLISAKNETWLLDKAIA